MEMDNYRPISILPTVSKLLERAVHHQLYQYLQVQFSLSFKKSLIRLIITYYYKSYLIWVY